VRKELYFFLVEAFFAGFFAAAFFVAIVTSWFFRLSVSFGCLDGAFYVTFLIFPLPGLIPVYLFGNPTNHLES
jgi:hypothetical protein